MFANSPLIFDDPPQHTRIRKLVGQAFTARQVALVSPWLSTLAATLFDAMGSGPVDVISEYCDPFPTRAIARLLGVPSGVPWSPQAVVPGQDLCGVPRGSGRPPDPRARRGRAWMCRVSRRTSSTWWPSAEPGRKKISSRRWRRPRRKGPRLADEEIAALGGVLLSAGNVTTTRLLGNLFHLLGTSADLMHRLHGDRALIAPVVEEVLRLESPVQFPARVTTRDVELSGTTIPAGHFVMVGLGSANHDGVYSPDPDCLRPGERPPHLAFGYGIHFCAGAALARQEAAITLHAILDRYDRVELAAAPVREEGLAHRGYAQLVVRMSDRDEPHSWRPIRSPERLTAVRSR